MNNEIRQTLAHHGREFYEHGWMMATAGNLSTRVGGGEVVITATGRHKGELGPEDFVRCRLAELLDEEVAGATSSDSVIHHTIYEQVDGAGAVYHVHEPHAVAASAALEVEESPGAIEFQGYPMVKAFGISEVETTVAMPVLPDVGRAAFVAERLEELFAEHPAGLEVPAVVAERHGVYAWGESPFEARRHVEAVAHLCECRVIGSGEG